MGLLDVAMNAAAGKLGITHEQMQAMINSATTDAPVVGAFFAIREVLEKLDGGFGISAHKKSPEGDPIWVASLEWGHEAPDSPMAAAAAYSQADTFNDCIVQLAKEAGLIPRD